VGAGAIAWALLAGTHQRSLWVVTDVLLAVVLAAVLVDRAPLSTGRLRAAADDIHLPYHRLVTERARGNSRCAPCPSIERRYRGPDLIPEAALIEVSGALAEAGYPLRITEAARRTGRLRTDDGEVRIDVAVTRQGDATSLTLTLASAGR
jgi:hypothetical protein